MPCTWLRTSQLKCCVRSLQAAQGAGEHALRQGSHAAQQAAQQAVPQVQRTVNEVSSQGAHVADTAQVRCRSRHEAARRVDNTR